MIMPLLWVCTVGPRRPRQQALRQLPRWYLQYPHLSCSFPYYFHLSDCPGWRIRGHKDYSSAWKGKAHGHEHGSSCRSLKGLLRTGTLFAWALGLSCDGSLNSLICWVHTPPHSSLLCCYELACVPPAPNSYAEDLTQTC